MGSLLMMSIRVLRLSVCIALAGSMFAGSVSAGLRTLPEPAGDALPSVFLVGDSTVRNGDASGGNGQWGWGEPFRDFFDSSKLNVVNRAVGGLSSRTYLTFGYWEGTKEHLKPGDFLIIQFGHNDASPINDDQRARGTIRGNGDEVEEIVNQMTGKQEVVHSYGWYLRNYIREAREKGVHPIVCSPVPRKSWDGAKVNRATSSYASWAREAAAAEDVPFVDLNDIVAERYEAIGQPGVEELFADKHTHTSMAGARLNAECVVAGLRALAIKDLTRFLTADGEKVSPARANQVAFVDPRPVLDELSDADVAMLRGAIPTLYIIGDSTVRNGHMDGVGWGEVVGQHFDRAKIDVANRAIGGRSTRSFTREGRWDDVYQKLKPGDFVIMQFGHNDGGRVGDIRYKRRPALPGIGDETQDVSLDDGRVEVVRTYGWYLKLFCTETKSKGATPIVCSPVPHKDNWRDGKFVPDFAEHRKWCGQVAKETGAKFVDLTALIGQRYQELGEAEVETLFADARTHTNKKGAEVNAECVVAGLRSIAALPLSLLVSEREQGERVGDVSAPLVSSRAE
ncbi:rhamnogalacturonan acetylesterase [Rhodopirellula sp. SWK7]|nr:rhamnogalacturonan acetylesterase [Rhodopirellula sp. SWK7]